MEKDMRFGVWYVRNMYRAKLLSTVARELTTHKLDLLDIQEVKYDKGSTVRARDFIFFYGKRNKNHQLGTGLYGTLQKLIGSYESRIC
jgi:hypothetical protein